MNTAKERLAVAIPYFRNAVNTAKANTDKGGKVQLGVLSVNADGSGKVEMQFDCEEFFKDIEEVIGAVPQTAEDDMKADALKFLHKHGLANKQ